MLTGSDTLRGIESINSTLLDDLYDARGFTLSSAAAPSTNRGDVIVTPRSAQRSPRTRSTNSAPTAATTRSSATTRPASASRPIFVETLTGTKPSVIATFSSANAGSATYGNTDGGYGSVTFTGTRSIIGSAGNDRSPAGRLPGLRGYYGNDTCSGGDGNDVLFGHNGGTRRPPTSARSIATTIGWTVVPATTCCAATSATTA